MNIVEFNPRPVIAELDSTFLLEFGPFDLNCVVWAESYFNPPEQLGGLEIMGRNLENYENWKVYAGTVIEVAHRIQVDPDNPPTVCAFTALINKVPEKEGGPAGAIARLSVAINQVLKNSFPDQPAESNNPDIPENLKSKNDLPPEEQKSTNWARVYVQVARELGISIDQFYSMTMRQVESILTEIAEVKHADLLNDMKLHGFNGKASKPQISKPKEIWSDEEKADFKKMNENLISELAAKKPQMENGAES